MSTYTIYATIQVHALTFEDMIKFLMHIPLRNEQSTYNCLCHALQNLTHSQSLVT